MCPVKFRVPRIEVTKLYVNVLFVYYVVIFKII